LEGEQKGKERNTKVRLKDRGNSRKGGGLREIGKKRDTEGLTGGCWLC